MSVSTQDKYEKDIKQIDVNIGKKTAELQNYISDLQIRIKTIEDEMNEDGDGSNQYASKASKE
jgi:hypothetical protein